MNDKAIQNLIENVEDPIMKATLSNIAGGNIIKQVRCLSKTCKGAVIAHIYHDGQIIEVKNSEKSGCLSSRKRFDGYMGFQCRCGQRSILSAQEKDTVGPVMPMPTKEELQEIAKRINKNPSSYQEQDGAIEVDGFIIEDFRG